MELQEQGVVEVHRVTVKRDTVKICTTTVSDLQHSRPPERDDGWLSKAKGSLLSSQPDALLQLQVWPHKPTSQGCCEVSRL